MMEITNIDTGNVILKSGEFRDGLLTFAGAGTLASGTILARDSVSGKYVPFVVGGSTNGNGVPKAVLTHSVTATGAGDRPCRPMISGVVRRQRLIVQADGNGTNITEAHLDLLRNVSIVTVDVAQLSKLDNQ